VCSSYAAATVLPFSRAGIGQGIDITFTEDGVIQEGDDYDDVWVYDTPPQITTLDMTGGEVAVLKNYDWSITNISGGLVAYALSYDNSTINISGGIVHEATISGTGTINMTDGTCWRLGVGNGVVNLYGGQITINGIRGHLGRVNIYGYGFEYDPYHAQYGGSDGMLTGFWADGTPFAIDFWEPAYDMVVLHEVPEPATLLLLGLGAVMLRRRVY